MADDQSYQKRKYTPIGKAWRRETTTGREVISGYIHPPDGSPRIKFDAWPNTRKTSPTDSDYNITLNTYVSKKEERGYDEENDPSIIGRVEQADSDSGSDSGDVPF